MVSSNTGVTSFIGGFSRSSIGAEVSKDLIGVGSRFLSGVLSRDDFFRGVLSRESTSFSAFFRRARVRDWDLERDRDDRRLFYKINHLKNIKIINQSCSYHISTLARENR